jgi:type II secretory pathway component PulK
VSAASREDGYALLAVLWLSVGIAGLALVISTAARDAIAPSRNRIALAAASWSVAGCVARVRAVLADAFVRDGPHTSATPKEWDRVDRALQALPPFAALGCTLEARAVGARLDVNASDAATLAQLLRYAGVPAGRADSVAGAIAAHQPYVDRRELHLVAGLASTTVLDAVLDVEPGPISLNHAPGAVLALLPGFTEATVQRMLDARAQGAPISTFHELSQLLSPDAPNASARLPGLAVFQPVAWVITVRASAGQPAVTAVVEVRLAKSGAGTTVTRHRSWIE